MPPELMEEDNGNLPNECSTLYNVLKEVTFFRDSVRFCASCVSFNWQIAVIFSHQVRWRCFIIIPVTDAYLKHPLLSILHFSLTFSFNPHSAHHFK